ncbi:hypothetical protein GCM10017687_60550 [Streptomyces echinatus]
MPRPLLALSTMVAAGVLTTGAMAVPAHSQPQAAQRAHTVRDTAISQARVNVTRHAGTFGFGAGQKLHVKDVVLDADGTQHVRFERTYRGLPVVGGDFVVHQKADGSLKGSTRAKAHTVALRSVVPAVGAKGTAAGALKRSHGLVRNARSTPELVVWAADGTPRLAWRTTVQGLGDKGQPARRGLRHRRHHRRGDRELRRRARGDRNRPLRVHR